MKKMLLLLFLIISTAFAVNINDTYSQSETLQNPNTISKYYSPDGIAIRGYDPVSYFREKSAKKGSSEFFYQWSNVTWWFSTESNRNLFINDPLKYAPQYGGYCALAVASGYTAKTEPKTAWTVYKNKLYLNYNKSSQKRWNKKRKDFIQQANKLWQSLLNKTSHTK